MNSLTSHCVAKLFLSSGTSGSRNFRIRFRQHIEDITSCLFCRRSAMQPRGCHGGDQEVGPLFNPVLTCNCHRSTIQLSFPIRPDFLLTRQLNQSNTWSGLFICWTSNPLTTDRFQLQSLMEKGVRWAFGSDSCRFLTLIQWGFSTTLCFFFDNFLSFTNLAFFLLRCLLRFFHDNYKKIALRLQKLGE